MNKINRTNCKRHEIHVVKVELCCGFITAVNLNLNVTHYTKSNPSYYIFIKIEENKQ